MKKIVIKKVLLWVIVGFLLTFLWSVIGSRPLGEERVFFSQASPIESQIDRASSDTAIVETWQSGYINRDGEWAIPFELFGVTTPFSSGVAWFGKWQEDGILRIGYLNPEGEYAIPLSLTTDLFDGYEYQFSEGLLPFRREPEGKIGFIDTTGKFVIEPQFDWVNGNFQEGLAIVGGQLNGYIDRTGKLVIDEEKVGLPKSPFHQGVAIVYREGRFGLIDREGNYLMEPILSSVDSWSGNHGLYPKFEFHSGLLRVKVGGSVEGSPYKIESEWAEKVGYVARSGGWAIEPQFFMGGRFSEGRAVVVKESAGAPDRELQSFIIDTEGRIIETQNQEPKPLFFSRFHEGLARARTENGLVGYIGRDGRWAIAPQFAEASRFSGGLAAVSAVGGKKGYIDRTGEFAIAPQFDRAEDFNEEEGVAIVRKCLPAGCKSALVNKRGAYVLPFKYDYISDFVEGVARITNIAEEQPGGRVHGYANSTGRIIVEPQFDRAEDFSEGLGLVTIYDSREPEASFQ